jgi:hypothetical protein
MAKETKQAIKLPEKCDQTSLLERLRAEKKAAFEFQARRHAQWDENYLLYRDKVQVNRLTQRHAVNIPLIKETVRTILPKIDEIPDVTFEDKGGDLEKEIAINAKWREDFDENMMEMIDYVDKKQVILYGRSYKKLNWIDGEFKPELKDIHDLLVDPKSSPLDIETAKYLIEPHIFRTLEEIVANEAYDKEARMKLKKKMDSGGKTAVQRSEQNKKMYEAREKRLQQMNDGKKFQDDIFANLDNAHIEELTQHFTQIWDDEKKEFVRYVILLADDIILRAEPLKDAIGVEFWPFEGWADDIEATDNWSDSVVDMIRTLNQIINIWISQLIENRTLRNFGMNFYDSTIEGFSPQKFQPRPGGWYPLPGKPTEVYQRVDVPELTGTTNEIQFLISIAEKASATGAVDKGVVESAKRTLGEIEIAVGKANERTTSMSKFYRLSWKQYAKKWVALLEANLPEDEKVTLFKKNPQGKLVGKDFSKEDLISDAGYKVVVETITERTADELDGIQKLLAVKQEFPNNAALKKAIQKRLIRMGGLSPEEAQEIENFEAQQIESQLGGGTEQGGEVNNVLSQVDELIKKVPTA